MIEKGAVRLIDEKLQQFDGVAQQFERFFNAENLQATLDSKVDNVRLK
jgi:hypothetical protein